MAFNRCRDIFLKDEWTVLVRLHVRSIKESLTMSQLIIMFDSQNTI